MEKHTPEQITELIAATQDGGSLKKPGVFNDFINECISRNTEGYTGDNSQSVNVEGLRDDFNYMIDQLKRAVNPLEELIS